MTNEKQKRDEDAQEKHPSAPDKAVNEPKEPAQQAPDEVHRRLTIGAAVPLMLLLAPCFMNAESNRSLWELTREESAAKIILILIFAWPVCLGAVCLVRGLRRQTPGTVLSVIGTIFSLLYVAGGGLLMSAIAWSGYRERKSPFIWAAGLMILLALLAIVRSLFRSGWQRLNHFVASMSLLACMIVLAIQGSEPRLFERASSGVWVFLFATAALLPFTVVTMTARRT